MFKKRDEFDEVAKYKKQQLLDQQKGERFAGRDDYIFEKEQKETQDNTKKSDEQKSDIFDTIQGILLIIVIICFILSYFFD